MLRKIKQHDLENKLKILEKSRSWDKNIEDYHKCKADLNEIYDNIAEGVKIRSKFHWYEENEKSIRYFLNLEKKNMQKNLLYED